MRTRLRGGGGGGRGVGGVGGGEGGQRRNSHPPMQAVF